MTAAPSPQRVEELRFRWDALTRRVTDAAQAAGRAPEELTVVAVTKTWPASDIVALRMIGVRDIGENRVQELLQKIGECTDASVHWNFIGQLQRNKAGAVAEHCAVLHTLDRAALVAPLERAAAAAGRELDVFVQLSLDGDTRRGGAPEADVPDLADRVAGSDHLRLVGVMALPPLGAPARPAFARLRELSDQLRRDHPAARSISAGMSGDLEEAVMEGATHLRVGTGLMGSRA